jgi:hypothetical protein
MRRRQVQRDDDFGGQLRVHIHLRRSPPATATKQHQRQHHHQQQQQ